MGRIKRTGNGGPKNLYQREGVFYARLQVDGRELRRSLKTSNEREAKRRLDRWLKDVSPYEGTIRHTFKEAATLWLEAGQWKPKTAAGYVKLLKILLAHFGDRFWDQVDKPALLAFMNERRAAGSGTATINRYLSVVSGIADHVKELPGWPEINPVTLLPKKPRRERRLPYTRPPPSDIEAYFARMTGTFGDLCRLALLCGARKDELVFLPRDRAVGGQAVFMDTKSRIPRTIDLTPEARAIVARQPVLVGSTFLFNSRYGTPYKRVTEMWREVVRRAQIMAHRNGRKLTRMRFHDLRHEYAIRYLEETAKNPQTRGSLYRLQKLMGHGSIRQTERYLVYLTPAQAETVKN